MLEFKTLKLIHSCGCLQWGQGHYAKICDLSDIGHIDLTHCVKPTESLVSRFKEVSVGFSKESYFVFESDKNVVVMHLDYDRLNAGTTISDITPVGYTYKGVYYVDDIMKSDADYEFVSKIFVATSRSTTGGVIPVLWRDSYNAGSPAFRFEFASKLDGGVISAVDKLCEDIRFNLPSVDLDVCPEDRYSSISIDGINYMYNRNTVAYNGRVTNLLMVAPAILKMLITNRNEFETVSFIPYLNGNISKDEVDFIFKVDGDSTSPVYNDSTDKAESFVPSKNSVKFSDRDPFKHIVETI